MNLQDAKQSFAGTEEWLKKEYGQIQTGRATPGVLDSITAEVYGARQPIKNIGSISVEDSRTLLVSPWDKSLLKVIEKAIIDSGLGLSLATGDSGVRVIFPQLTEESRARLAKVLKAKLEEARVSVRKERQEIIEQMEKEKKEGTLTEDALKKGKDDLQKLVDAVNTNLEEIYKDKEKEVMTL